MRITPDWIMKLAPNEVFVFGSNLDGMHAGGAARIAMHQFGAVWGQGAGAQGQSYAIPTMQDSVDKIKPYVTEFMEYVQKPENRNKKFLVTRIGCGIAGFRDEDIAPLFEKAKKLENVYLPMSFWTRK